MRWPTDRTPPIGTRKARTIFAFLPRKCDDGYTRWLERLTVVKEYRQIQESAYSEMGFYSVIVSRWVTVSVRSCA
jgi:hypothetical protein